MKDNSLSDLIAQFDGVRLGTLAFNLSAFAWIGLNLNFSGTSFTFQPGCYVLPNIVNLVSAAVLLYSGYLACLAIKRGSLIPAFITLTFIFAMVATVARQLSL